MARDILCWELYQLLQTSEHRYATPIGWRVSILRYGLHAKLITAQEIRHVDVQQSSVFSF